MNGQTNSETARKKIERLIFAFRSHDYLDAAAIEKCRFKQDCGGGNFLAETMIFGAIVEKTVRLK